MLFVSYHERYPIIETLPVIKGVCFGEQMKLLCYAKTAYIKDVGFLFDLQKFERDPIVKDIDIINEHDSIAAISFNFAGKDSSPTVTINLNAAGCNTVYADAVELPSLLDVTAYKGNDEQGWYWGVRFIISNEMLNSIYGDISFAPGMHINGSIYAYLLDHAREHFVSFAPFCNQHVSSFLNHSEFIISI